MYSSRFGRWAILISSSIVVGCATTRPPATNMPSATAITYRQPVVSYTLNSTFVLRECAKGAIPKVERQVSLLPLVSGDAKNSRVFDPETIQGKGRKALDIKVDLSDAFTLKTVNAGAADKTPAIITNVIKTIGSLFTLFAVADVRDDQHFCNDKTLAALETKKTLDEAKDDITKEREKVLKEASDPARPLPPLTVSQRLAALDARLAVIEAREGSLLTKQLTITHNAELNRDTLDSGVSKFKFTVPEEKQKKWLTAVDNEGFTTVLDLESGGRPTELGEKKPGEIVFRIPKEVGYSLCAKECPAKDAKDTAPILAKGMLVIPQWGEVRRVDFARAFGEDKTIGLGFDSLGRVTSLTYKRNAVGEAVSGAASSISSELVTSLRSAKYSDIDAELAELKKELEYYDTQVKLKDAREKYLKSLESPPAQ
jgi:hypothetical protein